MAPDGKTLKDREGTPMDKVFREEQEKLAEIETEIDTIASQYERRAKQLGEKICDFFGGDNEDRMNLSEIRQRKDKAEEQAAQWRSYQPSPYFGRLDLDAENEDKTITCYIGKAGIFHGGKVIVVDWRAPIGECYYIQNQKEFCVGGIQYLLALRRALDIQNGSLVSYHTEYDNETVSLEGDVIDPFLLTVLRDKRRYHRLTDIIRTIQSNQNEIIRRPRTESFVVQGCAGSGKTMILLHRLSFLKFNNRDMSLKGVKIITPNKFFDAYINDLSVELELTSIDRFSVEEYYVSLIERYSGKIKVDAVVQSEKILDVDLLADIYSTRYLQDSISHYHAYWKQVLSALDEARLKTAFERLRIPYPNTAVHTSDTASSLEQGIRRIAAAITGAEEQEKSIAARLDIIDKEMSEAQSELERVTVKLESTKKQTVSRIELEIDALDDTLQTYEDEAGGLRKQREELRRQREQTAAEAERSSAIVRMLSGRADAYSDYDRCLQLNDAASTLIRAECKDIIAAIDALERAHDTTPGYNFGRRNNLRRQIAAGKEQFSWAVYELISAQERDEQEKQDGLRTAISLLDNSITEADSAIRSLNANIRSAKGKLSALRECMTVFAESDLPDTEKGMPKEVHRDCASILTAYEEQRDIYNRIYRRLNSHAQTKQSLERERQEHTRNAFSSEEKIYITDCDRIVRRLRFNEISRNVMFQDLLTKYRAHKQKYHKTNYRHKLYLRLLYCMLYFTRLMNPDNFLSIDEAQDISIAEYKLLRMALGEKCIFNLYGDVNQSVYSYKGITDWDEIFDITGGNLYILNENYRNTLQITEFCNKEFEAEVYPIGISGEPVIEADIAAAVQWIVELKQQHSEYRVAILHRHGLKEIQDVLYALLENQDVSWHTVDEKKISVISVEAAKGLEFEAVVAIVDQMSSNEKYISYTRALDRLVVVRDKFSSELDRDEGEEEIDEDFWEPAEENAEVSRREG